MTEPVYYTTHDAAIGKLLLIGGASGLQRLTLVDNATAPLDSVASHYYPLPTKLPGFFTTTTQAIDSYLAGGDTLHIPFHIQNGTPLQRAVWLALTKIPYGQTISYSTLAEWVGFPRAIRAVASACGANPLPLIIPCHRVIAKDGSLGGFSLGGLEVKEYLLKLEQSQLKAAA